MFSNKSKLKILAVVVPIVFVIDQITKWWIDQNIAIGDSIAVIPGIFDLVHVRNRGAAFGSLANLPDSVRLPFFYLVSLVALGLITVYFFRLKDQRRSVFLCLGLILGGAAGNIFDRITLGEVVDFLSFHWYEKIWTWHFGGKLRYLRLEWPAFNVADAAITIAVIWLMIMMMSEKKES